MSWQLASFLILGAGLLAGFAWYERSRPPAQVVALVAALAALAIAGRIAFAAFPNVKPTTDIVVFAGYALGGAPGFAVGALTALVSNFWFGQGPWTPWQMAGWGMCGLLGAGLARLGGPNVGRLALAAVCGIAAIAYGALLNFSLMATYGGDLSLEHFLVLESRAVPFDAAHAAGNIVFALVAGPAMIRMLSRFRERFEWRRGEGPTPVRAPALAATLLLALAFATTMPAGAGAADTGGAANWLVSAQNRDGGFGDAPGDDSSASITAWAMLGLEAAGRNPLDVSRSGKTPVDYLRSKAGELESSGDFARTILALQGAGVDPRSFAGRNLVTALLNQRRDDGSYEGWPGSTAFAIVALRSAGVGGLEKSQAWLGGAQNSDGGWGDVPGAPSNADVTGAAMQAMPNSKAAQQGLSYLRNHQRGNGGFSLGSSGGANAQSTAWALQGMIAVGADPASVRAGGSSGLDYLTALQEGDGHFRYSSDSNQNPVWVTGQALAAAAGEAFPVAVAPRAPKPAATPTPVPLPTPEALPPVPIPGVTSPPAVPVPPLESSGSGGSAGGSGGAAPPVPGGSAASPPPVSGAGAILPPGTPPATVPEEPDGLVEATPASGVDADSDDPASPWIPVGIGLGVGLLALLVPLGLGRRFAW
jgi:energy-coupling factor transport system substrate-specific component